MEYYLNNKLNKVIVGVSFSKTTEHTPKFKKGKVYRFKKGKTGIAGSIILDTTYSAINDTLEELKNKPMLHYMIGDMRVVISGIEVLSIDNGSSNDDIGSSLQITYVATYLEFQ